MMPALVTIRVFTPFALGYLLVSVFRSINAVIAPDLVRDFGFSAAELAFAVSAMYWCGIILQLPYGMLLDRYDPRRVYASVLLLSALGAVITGLAHGIIMLSLGRVFLGLGVTASAVTAYRVNATWFTPERLPLANGLSLAAGGLGTMAGTVPVEVALRIVDWRVIHLVLGAMLVATAALVPMMVPNKAFEKTGATLSQQVKGLGDIVLSMKFWRIAPMLAVLGGTFGAFNTLWAGYWLRDVAGLSRLDAANLLLVLTAAFTVAGLSTGTLTNIANRVGLPLMEFVVATTGLFTLVLTILFAQWTPSPLVVAATWAAFGFTAALSFGTYAALAPQFAPNLTGRLNACLTLAWMLGAFLIQNLYAAVLNRFPATNDGYSIEGHRVGMALLIVLATIAMGWFLLSRQLARRLKKAHQTSARLPGIAS